MKDESVGPHLAYFKSVSKENRDQTNSPKYKFNQLDGSNTLQSPTLSGSMFGHRNVLRQRSVLNWSFWRRPNTQLDDGSDSTTGKLFGISLPNICENGNLPTPILNILWLLYERGPLTEGIFRQSASVKACRELKEKLNAGTDVQIYCEPLFVVASVFQDFLRSIPGSLLSSNMFEIWLSIMDEANPEERIRTIQLLLQHLPRDNITVLRYLFGVLHCIEQNSSLNKMNALNLAICIAPSILGPPRDTPKVETEIYEKMSKLIQFMIENCFQIFGEVIICLFGENNYFWSLD
ncbi:rho GTPase-activating protein 20-like [Sorex fumeus]|uniref:rho GTPase-activating protein 20-like n=1 Tax=Sorex fumeus TaxID=62283 RepID=UPI0024AD19F3|nr:rho GTPase-activating protein 20-like [Sorex fumeus]